jgi:hypothetical protein
MGNEERCPARSVRNGQPYCLQYKKVLFQFEGRVTKLSCCAVQNMNDHCERLPDADAPACPRCSSRAAIEISTDDAFSVHYVKPGTTTHCFGCGFEDHVSEGTELA